jgi:hypothetical protein
MEYSLGRVRKSLRQDGADTISTLGSLIASHIRQGKKKAPVYVGPSAYQVVGIKRAYYSTAGPRERVKFRERGRMFVFADETGREVPNIRPTGAPAGRCLDH